MKMNKLLIWLVFIVFQPNLFGQENALKPITWSAEKLTWDEYSADPDVENNAHAASTSSGITYSWTYSTANYVPDLDFEVTANFYPKRSWVKPAKKTPELLAHEQLHFDISELYARKLLNAFEGYVEMRNIRTDLKQIYSKIESMRNKMQTRYDKETNHGLDKTVQKKWNKKICEALIKS